MNTSRGQKKGLTESQIKLIKRLLKTETDKRDFCLFSTQLDTMLRSSDVLSLRVLDVRRNNGDIRETLDLKQKKTKRTITCVLQEDTRKYLDIFIKESKLSDEDYLFTGKKILKNKPLTLMGHTRLVKKWVELIELDKTEYSTHSLRRSKSIIVYKRTNNIEVVRQLLGHQSATSTSKYLGIEKQECLDISRSIVI